LPEFRKDPITGRWVIISTDRGKAPHRFLRESVLLTGPKNCPFCPGAEGKTPPEIPCTAQRRRRKQSRLEYSRSSKPFSRARHEAIWTGSEGLFDKNEWVVRTK